MRAAVIVLGDIGRSPRMQYHARALADAGVAVDLVGHAGTRADAGLESHERIRLHRLPHPRPVALSARRWHFLLRAAGRTLRETAQLLHLIAWALPRPDLVLVQTPPAIPTLVVAWCGARARGARFTIDWHNFGDRVLALRLGNSSPLVRLAARFERTLARRADAHLVVSDAMRLILERDWRVGPVRVLHDRPASRFTTLTDAERADARRELLSILGAEPSAHQAILVSPTSWTADEDTDLLLEALVLYDQRASNQRLLVALTGNGPRRAACEERIRSLALTRVTIYTTWLESDAYPRLLAAADLGVCLHRSASGVDLPMKVADCMGAGVPVCALDYGPCLREAIQPGVNGLVFADANELVQHLETLFAAPGAPEMLRRLRQGVAATRRETWEEGWQRCARQLLLPPPA